MAAGNSQSWRGEKESFWPGNITPNPINSPHKDHLLNTPHRIFDPWGLRILTYSKSLDSSHAAVRTATANTRQSGSFIPGEWTDNHVCGVGERRGRAPPPTVFPAVRMSPRCPCCTLDPGGQQDPTLLRLWMSREAGPGSQGLAMPPPLPGFVSAPHWPGPVTPRALHSAAAAAPANWSAAEILRPVPPLLNHHG